MESLHAIRDTGYQRQKMTFEQWSRFPPTGFRFETTRRTYTFPDRITKPNRIASSFLPPFSYNRGVSHRRRRGEKAFVSISTTTGYCTSKMRFPPSPYTPPPLSSNGMRRKLACRSRAIKTRNVFLCFSLSLSLSLSAQLLST